MMVNSSDLLRGAIAAFSLSIRMIWVATSGRKAALTGAAGSLDFQNQI